MTPNKKTAIIISISSDIGYAMGKRWLNKGWEVLGTCRTRSPRLNDLSGGIDGLVRCDLSDNESVNKACGELRDLAPKWDILVLCPGAQEPVGPFRESPFEEWARSVQSNFTNQLRIVHELLPSRNLSGNHKPAVLFFAGGGTNNAVVNYSAYTLSKIALIKMCELLDAEIPDTIFTIVGPGWVKTKIHDATLRAENRAGENYQKTRSMLAGNDCTPMDKVLDCCDWLLNAPREAVGGRNFSVVFDAWGSAALEEALIRNPNLYKLRRNGNDLVVARK